MNYLRRPRRSDAAHITDWSRGRYHGWIEHRGGVVVLRLSRDSEVRLAKENLNRVRRGHEQPDT